MKTNPVAGVKWKHDGHCHERAHDDKNDSKPGFFIHFQRECLNVLKKPKRPKGALNMSQETLNQLSAALESDKLLESKLRAAKSFDEVVSIATQHGHPVTLEDLKTSAALKGDRELSDDELDGVSAGKGKKHHSDQQQYLQLVLKDVLIASY